MEIRILRAADVRRFLPLRSIMVMPGERGMLGNMPGYLAEPECFGAQITAIWTAAASGLATSWLARPGAGDLTLLGAGEQAQSHLQAMLCVRALRRVRVWARDRDKARVFAQAEGARHGIEYRSLGLAAQDLAAGYHVFQQACLAAACQVIEF
jgi:ornithine cyclodeaminase